jgi:hypothetical protein
MRVRLRAALSLAVAVALWGMGGASTDARTMHQAGASATALNFYSPFDGAGIASGVVIAKSVRGSCGSALTDWRSVAWRCFGPGAVIHDPCFSSTTAKLDYVLCPLYTPRSGVLRIDLTKPLPKAEARNDSMSRPPWAIQLDGGIWCVSRGGMAGIPSVGGKDVTYLCQKATQSKASGNRFGDAGSLLGTPRRARSGWTILKAVGQRIGRVPIRSAWW